MSATLSFPRPLQPPPSGLQLPQKYIALTQANPSGAQNTAGPIPAPTHSFIQDTGAPGASQNSSINSTLPDAPKNSSRDSTFPSSGPMPGQNASNLNPSGFPTGNNVIDASGNKQGISGGAVAAIVLVLLFIISMAIAGGVIFRKRRRNRGEL